MKIKFYNVDTKERYYLDLEYFPFHVEACELCGMQMVQRVSHKFYPAGLGATYCENPECPILKLDFGINRNSNLSESKMHQYD